MNAGRNFRLACRAARLWRACASPQPRRSGLPADTIAAPSWIKRHIAHCTDCRHYFERIDALESALRSAAPAATFAPASDLHARIMQAVAQTPADAQPRRRLGSVAWVAVGAATALVALIAILQLRGIYTPGPSRTTPHIAAVPSPTTETAVARAPGPASVRSGDAPQPSDPLAPVAAALAQDPLQTEVDSVYADARNAVQFLALNFLPTSAIADIRNDHTRNRVLHRNGG